MDYLKVTDSGLEVGSIDRQNKAVGKERARGRERKGEEGERQQLSVEETG